MALGVMPGPLHPPFLNHFQGCAHWSFAACPPVPDPPQLAFHPNKHSFLASGSEDGLVCYFDTSLPTEEDVSGMGVVDHVHVPAAGIGMLPSTKLR